MTDYSKRLRAIARLNTRAEQAIRHWQWWSRTERYRGIVARMEYFRRNGI